MASFGRLDGSESSLNKVLDSSDWSITTTASTVDSQGGATLQIAGAPATDIYVTLDDLYNGQQGTIVNLSGQTAHVMNTLTYGSTTIWTQNSTANTPVGNGTALQFVFYVDNSNPSLGHVLSL